MEVRKFDFELMFYINDKRLKFNREDTVKDDTEDNIYLNFSI